LNAEGFSTGMDYVSKFVQGWVSKRKNNATGLIAKSAAQFRFYQSQHETKAINAVAAGMIGATGLKLLSALKTNPLGKKVCSVLVILSFVGIALVQWRLLYVLVILGGIGYVLAFLKLKDQA
jgi:hypothetical protein